MMHAEAAEEYEEELSEEERAKLEEAEAARQEQMQVFGQGLNRLFDEQVELKQELEARWLDDLRHYNGRYDRETEKNLTDEQKKTKRSRVFVNLTRAKSNTAESKWSDLILPTDDRNWGLKPTPVPELAKQITDDSPLKTIDGADVVDADTGEALTRGDLAKQEMEEARRACTNMENEIDDQLTEANYNTILREIIHDAVTLGTGIIKGPMVRQRSKRAWLKSGERWVLAYSEDTRPSVDRVDPWNFFPDMSATKWSEVEFTFERHLLTKKQLRRLAGQPGFMPEQVAKVLMSAPNARDASLSYLNELREINGITQIHNDKRYEVIEYHGPIEKADLIACGCEGVDIDDPLQEFEGVVWVCMGIVIKVGLNHMDSQELPYNILNWEKDETSIFGFGVPYRMRAPQRVMNASWRMVLDNAGLSTGPQILINKHLVEPADGVWELSPRKVWWMVSKDPKFRADYAMQTFRVDNNQQELTAIFEMAHRLADEETSVPQMQMGAMPGDTQQPAMLKTLGGTALWMSANNIMMRKAVKNFDDDITRPFITRFYDWNMQFNPRDDIKGDFNVDARGTSVLLVREMQARNLAEFAALAISLPGGSEELKVRGVLKSAAKSMQLNEDEVMRTDDEADAANNQQQEAPPDPELMKLQLQERIAQEESARKIAELESQERIAQMEMEVKMTEIAANTDRDLRKIQTDAGIKKYQVDMGIKQFYEELRLKEEKGITANYGLESEPT